jgi:hypothetical protein
MLARWPRPSLAGESQCQAPICVAATTTALWRARSQLVNALVAVPG